MSQQGPPSPSLLTPDANDDDDASSIRSASAQDTDSEDDEFVKGARSTLELAQHDRTVLAEEDERERLLVRKNSATGNLRRIFSGEHGNASSVRIGKRERRRQRRLGRRADRRKRNQQGKKTPEERELMYEMEEGGLRDESSSRSSLSSSDVDQRTPHDVFYRKVGGIIMIIFINEVLTYPWTQLIYVSPYVDVVRDVVST